MAASRKGLNRQFARRLRVFEERLADQGINVLMIDGFRTVEKQDALYARGRSKPGCVFTNHRGGESQHNHGLAADYAFVINGKVTWNGPWEVFGRVAKECGLQWGGDTDRSGAVHHVQWTGGRSIEEMRAPKS